MNRHTETNVWNDARSFDATADESECVEDMLGRFGFANRATRLSARAVFHRLVHSASVAIAKAVSGDCFYLISGAMVALDLALVIWLVRR